MLLSQYYLYKFLFIEQIISRFAALFNDISLTRYDVFRFAQNDVTRFTRNDAMFAPKH